MRRLISIILCAVLISTSIITAQADSLNSVPSSGISDSFEMIGGVITVMFSKLKNKITATNESGIEKAEYRKQSWTDITEDIPSVFTEEDIDCETWRMTEIKLTSQKSYSDSFNDADVDLLLWGNGRQYRIPGFWDGQNNWKVRFICPSEGIWYYRTLCSDADNSSLHNRTGKVNCKSYEGNLDIYKHGFVTTAYAQKYFTYDDGTPFLYIGDTHWSLGDETQSMVEYISQHRAEQGFTVMQSEPIGATFDFTDGITEADMEGLASFDAKFSTIAQYGLTHANAEFFFPAYMCTLIDNHGGFSGKEITKDGKTVREISDEAKVYLEKISRYWVARYSAFPVMWTLGQETDKDFYSSDTNHPEWNYINNPYKLVAEYIAKYDAYDHPLSAHMENTGSTTAMGKDANLLNRYSKNVSGSVFRDIEEHDWFAVQWSPSLKSRSDCKVEKDFWYNSKGKISINYEGRYCYLWTKDFGARMQGWASYLSGMYGYGWGGHDTWSYTNIYDEDNDSSDGLDTITSDEKKNATWLDAQKYASSYQVGYMKNFLSMTRWYNLIPRFDNKAYFSPCTDVYSYCASDKDNSEMVLYFYSFTDETVAQKANTKGTGGFKTGTIGSLQPSTEYHFRWFNPITGEISDEGTFTSTFLGTYYIGNKVWNNNTVSCDMIFYMYK